ncbi:MULTISPECIES: hypothetical protein [Pontibacillus]|uniref:Uncharacterized protein n=1 Tax=Pontibacillus chungwhensis TaxID=265426 RepID=A0ABY8V1I3_9BACI|nr:MULTISPECIES: hypothetical protein [Pontibacillus]MCD5324603.1 hypothetical protein [Pontibacillus sp. HN14]WIF99102.1 hypothetical protein QNI29_05455 [Pontibacillus chungwhensis]
MKKKLRVGGIVAMVIGLLAFFIGIPLFKGNGEPTLGDGLVILVSFLFVFAFGLCLTVVSKFMREQ